MDTIAYRFPVETIASVAKALLRSIQFSATDPPKRRREFFGDRHGMDLPAVIMIEWKMNEKCEETKRFKFHTLNGAT